LEFTIKAESGIACALVRRRSFDVEVPHGMGNPESRNHSLSEATVSGREVWALFRRAIERAAGVAETGQERCLMCGCPDVNKKPGYQI
jgi:hypothetical protein